MQSARRCASRYAALRRDSSSEAHVLGLRSTRSLILPDIEFDFIPRLRIDIPRFEISDVKKDVAAATVRLDKSEAPISNERLDYTTHS
jgi:hypothetical protein